MRIVTGDDANVAAWVAARIPLMHGRPFPPCAAIGVVDEEGRPLGGVVFTSHHPHYGSIELSFASASPRWLSKRIITAILSYPFNQLGCQRVTTVTPLKATSARRFLEVFGFRREGVVRRGFGTDDAVISGLLKEEWARSRFNVGRDPDAPVQVVRTNFPRVRRRAA